MATAEQVLALWQQLNPRERAAVFQLIAREVSFSAEVHAVADEAAHDIRVRAASTNSQWNPADPVIAGDCEALFQAGGPRVYYAQACAGNTLRPSDWSATRTLGLVDPPATVYARRKRPGTRSYAWFARVVLE